MAAGLSAEEWERARVELRNLAQAPAWSPQADSLPWADWIDQTRRTHPDLAAQTLIGAHAALDGKALSLALDLDEHGSADGLRLAAHRVLWAVDPDLAAPRARALLFRETPRAGDRLRPAYVEQILPEAPRAAADELFLQVAADDGMEHRARLLAIRAALARRLPDAGPVLESVFLTERNNFALRREALQALLALEPARGRALLGRAFEEEGTDPGFKAWIAELRAREGVAAR
jgi:hypothetical protein